MSDIRVSTESLSASAGALGGARGELDGQLDRLQRAANALAGQWAGDAQQAFLTRYSGWAGDMAHLSGVLGQASRAADEIAQIYRATDERVGALWGL